jgi:hypothetical protein
MLERLDSSSKLTKYRPARFDNLSSRLRKAHQKVKKRFLLDLETKLKHARQPRAIHGLPGVVGVGIGEKIRNGKFTGEPCVVVNVVRKLHQIDGIATDIIAFGEGYPLSDSRPKAMQPGESLRNVAGTPGTLACLVARQAENGLRDLCLLSNNHVIARSNAGTKRNISAGVNGDLIFYDVTLSDGTTHEFPIGYLADFATILFNRGENGVDCAIAVTSPNAVSPVNIGLGEIQPNALPPFIGAAVKKFGRHGFSTGVIRYVEQTVDLNYGAPGSARFVGQALVQSTSGGNFAEPGDSGALVVDQTSNRPIGLLFARIPPYAIVTPIEAVLNRLRVTLVT